MTNEPPSRSIAEVVASKVPTKRGAARVLLIAGILLTVAVAFWSWATSASAGLGIALASLSASAQLASMGLYNQTGRTEPNHARSAITRLYRNAAKAEATRKVTERIVSQAMVDRQTAVELGKISVNLSWIEESLTDSVEDWKMFHSDATNDVQQRLDQGAERSGQ